MRKTGLKFTWNNGSKNDNAIVTVVGILLTIPLVSSASSTGERLETRNAVI